MQTRKNLIKKWLVYLRRREDTMSQTVKLMATFSYCSVYIKHSYRPVRLRDLLLSQLRTLLVCVPVQEQRSQCTEVMRKVSVELQHTGSCQGIGHLSMKYITKEGVLSLLIGYIWAIQTILVDPLLLKYSDVGYQKKREYYLSILWIIYGQWGNLLLERKLGRLGLLYRGIIDQNRYSQTLSMVVLYFSWALIDISHLWEEVLGGWSIQNKWASVSVFQANFSFCEPVSVRC